MAWVCGCSGLFCEQKTAFWGLFFWALVLGKSFSFPSECSFFRVCIGFFRERGFLGIVSSSLAGLGFHSVIVGLTCYGGKTTNKATFVRKSSHFMFEVMKTFSLSPASVLIIVAL